MITKREIKQAFHGRDQELSKHIRFNRKLCRELFQYGEQGCAAPLYNSKFKKYVCWLVDQGFTYKTALRIARYGVGQLSTHPAEYFAINADGLIADSIEIEQHR